MGARTDDERAFQKTIAGLGLPTDPTGFDETVVPDEVPHSWSSFRGSGPLPTIAARPIESGDDAELTLVDVLGEGGMGRVYLATQRSLGRKVAVKTVKDADSQRSVDALCDEAVVTGRLSHPNIIPVHALGRDDDGRPLLIMKRVEGVGWNELVASPDHEFWSRNETAEDDRLLHHVDVLRKVAHAVELAHSEGIVHRDIKPENVMLGDFGEVYLVDWGIAARTGTPVGDKLAGTPHYLAPEMVGGVLDERTDVYLLGATLHEILTGKPPHSGDNLTAVLFSAFQSKPHTYADDVPEELAELATHAMARRPDDRPPSARAFGDALDDYVRHRGSRALSRTGEARLEALRAQVERVPAGERDLGELRRLVAECRFAFQEAGREWADNPAVTPGLDACLRLAARIELDRRDGEGARAALDEIAAPEPELVEEVEQLEEDLAREAEEHSRLAEMAKELDPKLARGVRIFGGAVAAGAIVAISVYAMITKEFTTTHVFVLSLGMLAALGFVLLVLWKRIMRTLFNRRFAAWVAVGVSGIVLHRFVALFDPSATVEMVLTYDLVIVAVFWGFGSLFLFRWMLFVGIGLALCLWPAFVYPEHIATIFSGANLLAVVTFMVGWRSGTREEG
jgi:serine/threonine-protein kinase